MKLAHTGCIEKDTRRYRTCRRLALITTFGLVVEGEREQHRDRV